MNQTLIFGHRGFPEKFPENSLSGFEYALTHQIDGLEFDVHLTKDQIPVIIHDETIDRVSDGHGFIKEMTFNQLRRFHLKNGEPIPTLNGLLELAKRYPVHLNLEFKTNFVTYPNIEQIVLEMVHDYRLTYPVIYSSFNLKSLQNAYRLDTKQNYCLLTDQTIVDPEQLMQREHLSGFHFSYAQSPKHIPQRIWTVNDANQIQTLLDLKVSGIITDNFELAQAIKAHHHPVMA